VSFCAQSRARVARFGASRQAAQDCAAWMLLLAAMGGSGVAEPATSMAGNHKLVRIVALEDSTTASAKDWAPEIQEMYADCLTRRLRSSG